MNGFIRQLGKGVLMLAAACTAAGCATLDVLAPHPTPVGVGSYNDGTENYAHGACKGCGVRCGGHCGLGIGDKLRNFDWEQLHPDHCWPEQYSRESMRRVNVPLAQQLHNGNLIELTIWDHYFETEEDREASLNGAGMARLQYLARKKPYVISDLLIQTSFDAELDKQRIDAVKEYAGQFGFHPELTVVNRIPRGLFGAEAPKAITKMLGPAAGPPAYEPQIKADFYSGGN